METLNMRKCIVLVLLIAVFVSAAFSDAKTGFSITFNEEMSDVDRFSIEASDRLLWRFGDEEKKFSFSLLTEGIGGVSFADYDDEPHVHLDISFAVLPGVNIRFNEAVSMNIGLGLKYSRIGHAGDVEKANDWDKFLSIMTLGLAGSHPLRKVELALDASVKLVFVSLGLTAGLPVLQAQSDEYLQGLSTSVYGAIDLNF